MNQKKIAKSSFMAYLALILDTDQPSTKSRGMGNMHRGKWILTWTVVFCNHHSGGNQTLRQKLPQAAHPETLKRAFSTKHGSICLNVTRRM